MIHALTGCDAIPMRVFPFRQSDLGFKQAAVLAKWLTTEHAELLLNGEGKFDSMYVSPCLRTLQTSKPVAEAMQLTPTVWTDIYETGGLFEGRNGVGVGGLSRMEMTAGFPGYRLPDDITDAGWYARAGFLCGREDRSQCRKRARAVQKRIVDMAGSLPQDGGGARVKKIALVVHGDFISELLTALLSTGDSAVYQSYNTAIHTVDVYADGSTAVLMMNSVEHLRQDGSANLCRTATLGRV